MRPERRIPPGKKGEEGSGASNEMPALPEIPFDSCPQGLFFCGLFLPVAVLNADSFNV